MYSTAMNLEVDQLVIPKVKKTDSLMAKQVKKQSFILLVVEDDSQRRISRWGNFTCTTIEEVSNHLTARQPDLILVSSNLGNEFGKHFGFLKSYGQGHSVPVVLYSSSFSILNRNIALKFGFDDYYFGEFSKSFFKKIRFYKKLKAYRANQSRRPRARQWCSRRVNVIKRAIDIALSSIVLLALSPLLIVIALLIKLESRGPVFYVSKRAGFGYKIFSFYKFRSMRVNADKEVELLRQHNQYGESAFFKLRNDPRVTPLGSFLRNTSLDELPQLFNVLKGDMSLVGNRPLPLYEAEHLTKEKIAGRFLAPAGITGLWQITKRGKGDVTESERIKLDLTYARKWSVWFDLKILLGTLPALLQKESV